MRKAWKTGADWMASLRVLKKTRVTDQLPRLVREKTNLGGPEPQGFRQWGQVGIAWPEMPWSLGAIQTAQTDEGKHMVCWLA